MVTGKGSKTPAGGKGMLAAACEAPQRAGLSWRKATVLCLLAPDLNH